MVKKYKVFIFLVISLSFFGACANNQDDENNSGLEENNLNSRIETEELTVYLEPEIIEDINEIPEITYYVENNTEEQLSVSHGLIEFYDDEQEEWVDSDAQIISDMMMRYAEPDEIFERSIATDQLANLEDGLYRIIIYVGEDEYRLEFLIGKRQ